MWELIGQLIIIIIFLMMVCSIIVIFSYNNLQSLGQKIKSENSNIKISIQKRQELIDKLMLVTEKYESYEKSIYLSSFDNLKEMFSKSNIDTNLNPKLLDLKADEIYKELIQNIKDMENELSLKKERYNICVRLYNSRRVSFPNILFLNKFKFNEAPYFDDDDINNVKHFKTDDGKIIKDMIKRGSEQVAKTTSQATTQATDFTKKSFQMAKESIDMVKSNINSTSYEIEENKDLSQLNESVEKEENS